MGLADLIIRRVTKAQIGLIQFDCSVSETHTGEATITDHPVEEGANISDHIRPTPDAIEINGVVTNTPIVFLASLTAESPIEGDMLPTASRAELAYSELRRVKNAGELVDVVTTLWQYKNMAITSLVVSRDQKTGNVLDCVVSLREILIAQTETVPIPEPENVGNKKIQNKGKKVKTPANTKQEEDTGGILYKAYNAIRGG